MQFTPQNLAKGSLTNVYALEWQEAVFHSTELEVDSPGELAINGSFKSIF